MRISPSASVIESGQAVQGSEYTVAGQLYAHAMLSRDFLKRGNRGQGVAG
jgi:hypothetical protein